MKTNKYILLVALLYAKCLLNAQEPITVSESSLLIGNGSVPAWSVTIPESEIEKVKKDWIKELQSGTRSDVVNDYNKMTIFGAMIKDVSADPINIYSEFSPQGSSLLLTASFELKKDEFVASGSAAESSAKDLLKNFAKNQYSEVVKGQLQVENKKLREIQNELNMLENEKNKLEKSVESNKSAISEENSKIAAMNTDLANVDAEIASQNEQLAGMEEGPTKEQKKDYINDLEKKKKQLSGDIESAQNKVKKSTDEINQAETTIPQNESNQDLLTERINEQESLVSRFNEKLNKIETY